jgi:hypothetical protein
MCAHSQVSEGQQPQALCSACEIEIRLETAAGLRRLSLYLAAWARFDEWLRNRPAASEAA